MVVDEAVELGRRDAEGSVGPRTHETQQVDGDGMAKGVNDGECRPRMRAMAAPARVARTMADDEADEASTATRTA